MKQMCKYALVQFMPFVETGEFANVGVILCVPRKGYWDFKLAPTQFGRVTAFFNEMDKKVYQVAVKNFNAEMSVTQKFGQELHNEDSVRFFTEITRPREALLRFSTVRTLLTEDPEKELEALYDRFIHRDFVTEAYKEQQMVTALKKQFTNENIPVKYTEKKLKVGIREFTIPLASSTNKGLKLIKPLAFDQKRPTQILEHGESWFNRLRSLLDENLVETDNILLPVDAAKSLKDERREAFEEVKALFQSEHINLVNYSEKVKIIEFARDILH
jgi:hypothetical protein